ncbi:hypothetical protein, partial [Hymenobacter coccineus]|uniref:hypothetical protein n=1 Tax=Hymenobacter coccineus TaxID=1908235 RepID=UPI000A7BD3FF
MNPGIPLAKNMAAIPCQSPTSRTSAPLTAAQKLLLPLGLLLFNWLFWAEKTGVNVLVYAVFVVGTQVGLLPRHAAARRSGLFWLAAAGIITDTAPATVPSPSTSFEFAPLMMLPLSCSGF